MSNSSILLTPSDILAGSTLLIYGLIGMILYIMVFLGMRRCSKEIIGFRFLMSMAIADILLLSQFGVWGGLVILRKQTYVPDEYRWHAHIIMDFIWFAMCYHYPLVAWTRLAAIRTPAWFKALTYKFCYSLCGALWFIAFFHSFALHFHKDYVIFYFNPESYGMVAENWDKYLEIGWYLYTAFHVVMMVTPFFFYAVAIYKIFKVKVSPSGHQFTKNLARNGQNVQNFNLAIEKRLLLPCFINTTLFVLGQITLHVGLGGDKWGGWSVMLVFLTNSFVNPILYLVSARFLRQKVTQAVCCLDDDEMLVL